LATLQLWQTPLAPDEQPVSQHTPSTQFPLPHCAAAVQVEPLPFLPHELFTHVFGLTHWLSAVQLVRQSPDVGSQVKDPHDTAAGAGQASPRPSQNDAASDVALSAHDGARHWFVVW
jgi:hypothetical protein